MREKSAPSLRRLIVPAAAFFVSVWLCYAGGKHELASHYARSADFEDWDRAARIEPDNPAIWYQTARFYQMDFDHADLPRAVADYRRALQLDPPSPYYKLDLASALEMTGDMAEADRYFRAAQASYPISAEVAWRYGNFLLRQERLPDAYTEIHRALLTDSKLVPLGISRVWRSDENVQRLMDVLPDTAEADWDALSYLTEAKKPAASVAVWDRLVARKAALDWTKVFALTDMLVAQGQYADAGDVWKQAVATDDAADYTEGTLIYDGGFERGLSQGGFGWRLQDIAGAQFSFDASEKHSGNRSARVSFDGTQNLAYGALSQYVLVQPATRYRFQGYIRTAELSTDSGLRFSIIDPQNPPKLSLMTPNETGTEPWTLEQLDFTTGPQTHMILVRLSRIPSNRFDNKIRGTAWIDDLSITPLGTGHDRLPEKSPGANSGRSLADSPASSVGIPRRQLRPPA